MAAKRVETITETELLDALAAATAGRGPANARTVTELAAKANVTRIRVSKVLHEMKRAGRLRVHRVTREALDGRQAMVVAYTITPKGAKK